MEVCVSFFESYCLYSKTVEEYKSEIKVCSLCISLCIGSFSTAQKKDSDLMMGKKQL